MCSQGMLSCVFDVSATIVLIMIILINVIAISASGATINVASVYM